MIEARAVKNAARALLLGWDPMKFLNYADGVEREIADAVLYAAIEMKREDDEVFWKNMATSVQIGIARAFK